ncbi:HAMP domain-containing histidine kinase [Bacillus sp. NTK071]|uniref:sensor histidine kinase n=1 Tax=Bacillus sp. NTK071 TaxID=2802175 RepID=UPI001A8F9505|nr:HAMP domain-containing sensor histidine kinase [Bacillus sp. NTK071]MBN8209985.1 HAMP domain-containing histidine kinase [Bacillus sp. NTK071]
MKKFNIGTKLFLSYLVLIAVILLITTFSFRYLFQEYLVREAGDQLHKEGLQISKMLEDKRWNGERSPGGWLDRRRIDLAGNLISSQFIIYNRDHNVIYANVDEDVQTEYEENKGKSFVTEQVAIKRLGEQIGSVVLFTKVESLAGFNQIIQQSQTISLIASAAVAVILAAFLQKGLTGPISLLAEHMRQFSMRKKQKPLNLKTNDEINELAETFQVLSEQLYKFDLDQKEFLQNASHELKTPLMAIQGNAEGILDEVIVGDDIDASLEIIVKETQRLKKIVQDISYLTRLETIEEAFKYELIEVDDVISAALTTMRPLANKRHIKINYNNETSFDVKMDPDKMTQALINLIGNALRFASAFIEVRVYRNEEFVCIEIQDDGPGFGDAADRVFDRFFTGDQKGSGIGLSITKTIVEKHGGSILASDNDVGARVVISLPNSN